MDIIGTMDAQNWITFILNCIVGLYMFRKRSKAHRHILFILQNIQRRDLIAIFLGHLGLGGWVSLRRFIHFHLREKKMESKIPWKEFGLLLFKCCLKKRVQLSDEYVC